MCTGADARADGALSCVGGFHSQPAGGLQSRRGAHTQPETCGSCAGDGGEREYFEVFSIVCVNSKFSPLPIFLNSLCLCDDAFRRCHKEKLKMTNSGVFAIISSLRPFPPTNRRI